jgi:hypothetical protein
MACKPCAEKQIEIDRLRAEKAALQSGFLEQANQLLHIRRILFDRPDACAASAGAGSTSIPIREIGASLADALSPTNNWLDKIECHTRPLSVKSAGLDTGPLVKILAEINASIISLGRAIMILYKIKKD